MKLTLTAEQRLFLIYIVKNWQSSTTDPMEAKKDVRLQREIIDALYEEVKS